THTRAHTHAHAHTHTKTHTRARAHTHAYTHARALTHTHTRARQPPPHSNSARPSLISQSSSWQGPDRHGDITTDHFSPKLNTIQGIWLFRGSAHDISISHHFPRVRVSHT